MSHRTTLEWRGRDLDTLADIVAPKLKVLFVGLNPSPVSVQAGHYHQGRLGKQFWQVLVGGGLLPQPVAGAYPDDLLLGFGLGITDLVKVASRRADALTAADIAHGCSRLLRKVNELQPKLVCTVYKRAVAACGVDVRGRWGLIEERLGSSQIFLLPFPYRPKIEVDDALVQLKRMCARGA